MQRAHRLAWSFANGPIPDGMCVCHRCDNPPCCNPAHLFLGTEADNRADKMAKGRARGPGPRKLTDQATIAAIVSDRRAHRSIAGDYGVSQTLISKIKRRHSAPGGPGQS